jgi:hypothetical protein
MEKSKYSSQSETEKVFSIFDSFQKGAVNTVSTSTEPVLTMSSLGQLGRFGNQLFQSIRIYLASKIQGLIGIFKSFLYTLGWRSIWKYEVAE